MQKIAKEEFLEMKANAIDVFAYPKGNFWIFHNSVDNKFYPVRHKSHQYWIGKPTKNFTEIIRAIWSIDNMAWQNPANQKIFH